MCRQKDSFSGMLATMAMLMRPLTSFMPPASHEALCFEAVAEILGLAENSEVADSNRESEGRVCKISCSTVSQAQAAETAAAPSPTGYPKAARCGDDGFAYKATPQNTNSTKPVPGNHSGCTAVMRGPLGSLVGGAAARSACTVPARCAPPNRVLPL